jgi:hypothetical protein
MTGAGATAGELGPPGRVDNLYSEFNDVASLTWVKSNHTFKFGGSLNIFNRSPSEHPERRPDSSWPRVAIYQGKAQQRVGFRLVLL